MSRPGRKARNFFACRLLSQPNVVSALKIEPELRADAEPMAETQRRVACDVALPLDDLNHAIRRHLDLPRKLRRRNAQFRELIGENFAGVDGGAGYGMLLSY